MTLSEINLRLRELYPQALETLASLDKNIVYIDSDYDVEIEFVNCLQFMAWLELTFPEALTYLKPSDIYYDRPLKVCWQNDKNDNKVEAEFFQDRYHHELEIIVYGKESKAWPYFTVPCAWGGYDYLKNNDFVSEVIRYIKHGMNLTS